MIAPVLGAGLLALTACSSEPVSRDSTAADFATSLAHHDAGALATVLGGTAAQASQIVDATRDFTPTGEPVVGGHGDSALLTCVWVRGTSAQGETSFIAGQMLWDEAESRYVVLPNFLPGSSSTDRLPCSDPPQGVAGLDRFTPPPAS